MINNRLRNCCNRCNDIDIKTNTITEMCHEEVIVRKVEMFCTHEKVCKKLIEYNDRFYRPDTNI